MMPGPRWLGWFGMFNEVVLAALAALPLAVLAVWALAHWRSRSGTAPAKAWGLALADVGLVYGTVPWVAITMLPGAQAGTASGRVVLEPLQDLPTMSTAQIVGNLLILAALGFLAPLRFRSLASLPRILLLAAACSASIETAQYVLRLDRVSSVDDVLLNTAGAGLAALASWPWWGAAGRMRSGGRRTAPVTGY
jgi:VanZ like family